MMDPKDHVVAVGPKKGACYVCGKDLERSGSLQVNANVPLTKIKKTVGRACLSCSIEFQTFLMGRIAQLQRGEYQA